MRIIVETIPHDCQRYDTVGDWQWDNGTLRVNVSDHILSGRQRFLIALHEIIEAVLCEYDGISQEMVDDFDLKQIAEQADGEPGSHPDAPYRRQHEFATAIEMLLADRISIDWHKYEEAINGDPGQGSG